MKSVYTGGEKVAEFESYDELRVGENKPAFIYEGNELVYPNPVKDGLALWYDFSGRTNADGQRGIAEDLSGNGNHGTLQNFNFTPESGYDKNKLLFDGVDDGVIVNNNASLNLVEGLTLESVFNISEMRIGDLIAKGTSFSGAQNYSLAIHSNGALYFDVGNDGSRFFTTVNLGEFTSKSVCVQGVAHGGGLDLYVNGKLVSKNTGSILFTPVDVSLGISALSSRKFRGRIHSTRIYDRPLEPEELYHNYSLEKHRLAIEDNTSTPPIPKLFPIGTAAINQTFKIGDK